MLQNSGSLYAEEMLVRGSSFEDVNWEKFQAFYEKKYGAPCLPEDRERYFCNLGLAQDGTLKLAGALLFGKHLQRILPGHFITAIWFWGDDVAESDYRSSENLTGTLDELYRKDFDFIYSKLQKVQNGQSFNSLGVPEVPPIVLTEMLVNALIHRDYFIQDTIKLFVFQRSIRIISPGKLPNSLTEAQIRQGIRKKRNNLLDSFAPDLMDYRGAGSGILRALKAYPQIDFIHDTEAEQFTVIIHRPAT
ncbi:MAG: ATP-binding protein [Bacteroidia bacterium]|nr:ATP-binding protein [Bacteroidia bacterium]